MAGDTKAKEADAAPDAKAKGGKKKLIMIIAAALLLGGGGGGYYVVKSKQAAAEEGDEEHEVSRSKKKAPIFLALDPFTVNLSGEHNRFAQVAVTLDVANPETSEALKAIMPAVRDKVLRIVSSKTPADLLSPDGKELLSMQLATDVAKLIGWEPPEEESPKKKVKLDKTGKGKASEKSEDEAEAEDEDEDKAKAKAKAARKAKAKKRAKPNPINEVHFSQFIVQ